MREHVMDVSGRFGRGAMIVQRRSCDWERMREGEIERGKDRGHIASTPKASGLKNNY